MRNHLAIALTVVAAAACQDGPSRDWPRPDYPALAPSATAVSADTSGTPPPPPAADNPDRDALAKLIRNRYRKYEYRIPMRDGTKLFTAVYVPDDASPRKRYPFLMLRTPYTVAPYGTDRYDDSLGPTPAFPAAGYIFVQQDVRGKGMSEGEFVDVRPHLPTKTGTAFDESSDAYDTIAWLLGHVPNNNGKVGVWGVSYPGFYAAEAAIDAHPALVAASPQAPVTDWWNGDDMHRHGCFNLQEAFTFFSRFGRRRAGPSSDESKAAWPELAFGTPDQYAFFLGLGPLSEIDATDFGAEVPVWSEFAAHPDNDAYWKARDHSQYLRGIRPAVLTVGGFYDTENLHGALVTYRAIERGGPKAGNTIVMGPWQHGRWNNFGTGEKLGDAEFGFVTTAAYQELVLRFFEHHLKGGPATEVPEAMMFESGANRWHRLDQWPPADARPAKLYLGADSQLTIDRAPVGGAEEHADEFVSDPARPVPYTSQTQIQWWSAGYMAEDQRPFSRRPDVLVYQTPPLDHDVTLAGPLTANLFVSTTGTDADWVVKLIDVNPDTPPGDEPSSPGPRGGQQTLVRGEPFRGRYRVSDSAPTPFVPGEITPVRFTLDDVFHTFGRGHRIMVQVQSSWFPFVDRNPQTFVPNIFAAKRADFVKATHRVYASADHPSALEVQIVPGADE